MQEEERFFIKIIEDRVDSLEEGEKQTRELLLTTISHKRAFLGNLMTISAALIAGLFILLTIKSEIFFYPAIFSILPLALFILGSTIYLGSILSQESVLIGKRLRFVKNSKKDFISKINKELYDIKSYKKYREEQYQDEKELPTKVKVAGETWFRILVLLFAVSVCYIISMLLVFVQILPY